MADMVRLQTPLETLGTVLPTANALVQFQGRQAVGQALQQSTDPQTGAVDLMQFNRLVAANPQARGAMQDAASQSQALQGQQQALGNSRNAQLGSALGAVLDLPDAQLHDGAASALGRLVTMGVLPQDRATAIALKLPNDPAALRTTLRQVQLSLQSPDAQQGQTNGRTSLENNGGELVPVTTVQPVAGVRPGGIAQGPGSVTLTATPGQAAAPETRRGANGQDITAPAGGYMPTGLQPAGMRQGAMGNGRYPTAATPAALPGANGAPMAGPAPGTMENNQADVGQYRTDLAAVPAAQQRVQTLQEARSALQQARTGKGPAGSTLQSVLSVINTISPETAKSIGSATGTDVEKYDLAKKYLTDYARQSGAATQSDAQLSAAQGSNASVDITNQAAQDVVSLQIGRERQKIAQVQEHKDTNGLGYGQHASGFASSTDARGFAWDTYSSEQQAAIRKSVTGNDAAQKRLARSIGMAKRLGMLQTPGGQ